MNERMCVIVYLCLRNAETTCAAFSALDKVFFNIENETRVIKIDLIDL